MPWNFPFWQVFRCAVPALVAGNVVVLKHAENVPGCALAIQDAFLRAGFPTGVFSSLLIGRDAAQRVISHPTIAGVALTGSVRAGREVAARAGHYLKKCVLELGGSDPFIVLADADLSHAVEVAVKARIINNGQSCIAAKRFILEAAIADRFEEAFVLRMKKLHLGDPIETKTEVGPLAREDLLNALHEQVMASVSQGARLLCGGERILRPGFYYPPTVLGQVVPGMPAFDDETFGPVAALIRADDARHAIALANQSDFGLGASLWTRDLDRARALAAHLHAGSVFVNSMVVSDPRLPFGGVKDSGFGRELGRYGAREFVNVKTVSIA
jgi:succinate-semialdehyde dehydrogenase/glutarate-semialdehyde dehydrogenase